MSTCPNLEGSTQGNFVNLNPQTTNDTQMDQITPRKAFIQGFVQLFNPAEPKFIRALESVNEDFPLDEIRFLASFFMSIGLVPPRLDEWSIAIGAASAQLLQMKLV